MYTALHDASRVSHFHPLRPEEPLEVLTLDLLTSHGPTAVRQAVDALAALHGFGPKDAFRSAMTSLSPWRNSYLYAKGLSRDTFPLLAIEAKSTLEIEAAEAFFAMHETGGMSATRLGLFLRVEMTGEGTHDMYDSLSRVATMLHWLQRERSPFELKVVEIEFDTDQMRDRELAEASRVLSLALQEIHPPPAFKVSLGGIGSVNATASRVSWGKLFQTMCRVGGKLDRGLIVQGNELDLSFAKNADPRICVALWSAVAFSSGISRLCVHSGDDPLGNVPAKYLAMTLLSPVSQVRQLDWSNIIFREDEVDALAQVKRASTSEEVAGVLWNSEWSSRDAPMELASLNESIARELGWVLHDSTSAETIDVFIPGFGQCTVQRDQWNRISDSRDHPWASPSVRECKLTRFESTLQLQQWTTHIQAARFFRLMGTSLQFIDLKPWENLATLDLVLAILESCPHLRELTIHQIQLPRRIIEVDPTRLVSTSLIKLKLLFVNEPSPAPLLGVFTELFIVAVIPTIGMKMEYLEIRKQPGIIPFCRAFAKITQTCVSLFHLKLQHLDVETLDPLIQSYREGTSRVSSLYLLKCPVESSSLVRFADFLSDRTCVGSFKLGVLHVTHFADYLSDSVQLRGLDATSIKAMLAMLEKNRTLTELYLGVTDTGIGQIVAEPLRPLKRRFDVYDEQEIPVASEKYPADSLAAFVDVLHWRKFPYDQEAIRIVAGFAAPRIRRSVRYDVVN